MVQEQIILYTAKVRDGMLTPSCEIGSHALLILDLPMGTQGIYSFLQHLRALADRHVD